MKRIILGFLFVIGANSAAMSSPILTVENGQLIGAQNVNVEGILYDVEFIDTTCIAIFDGCDDILKLDFNFSNFSHAPSQALINQVFIDSNLGNFDSDPSLTNGCTSNTECWIIMPNFIQDNQLIFSGFVARNTNNELLDSGTCCAVGATISDDFSNNPTRTFAKFSEVKIQQVSEPTSLGIISLILFGISTIARRR